jgi:hypothetical protein
MKVAFAIDAKDVSAGTTAEAKLPVAPRLIGGVLENFPGRTLAYLWTQITVLLSHDPHEDSTV